MLSNRKRYYVVEAKAQVSINEFIEFIDNVVSLRSLYNVTVFLELDHLKRIIQRSTREASITSFLITNFTKKIDERYIYN